ncbi:hypothetical protein E0K89_017825 [Aquicoccus sp. SCR17]|nr:hypothetical protein [Carideicomes alvinocaridis]
MTDMADPFPPEDALRLVESCLALTGEDSWAVPFSHLVEAAGAAQIMVFSYGPQRTECLLSRNFREGVLGGRLAEIYIRGWHLEDPLRPVVLGAEAPSLRVKDWPELHGEMSDSYRMELFTRPGLQGKTAILAVGHRLRLILNLYWSAEPEGHPAAHEFRRLLGRLALMHFEARSEHELPAPLAVLSDRERSVCQGILSGMKAEQIAATLDIAPSSVVTYRARAYQKLGISSRGALFELCRGQGDKL